jgi:curved DNA-binding protein CbpA
MKTLYDLLAVSPDADAKALKIAFRRAVKANHPDLHPEDPRVLPKFMQIVAANSILPVTATITI